MSTTIRSFSDLINFSRGSGKTYTNAAGLIVGVDFSSTSNTITTGSKTFTLDADLNVNRDWATGSAVRAVDQVGGGAMVGTVTSYAPSTQALVIEVNSVTGSGTSTNWRIGTLEITRDVLTNAVSSEPAATNLLTFSEQFENAVWSKGNLTVSSNVTLSPDGSVNADKLVENAGGGTKQIFQTPSASLVAGSTYAFSCFVKAAERNFIQIATSSTAFGASNPAANINLSTGQVVSTQNNAVVSVTPFPNGWFRVAMLATAISTVSNPGFDLRISQSGADSGNYTGDGTSGIFIWGAQLELNAPTSYIPTTTAQVTRNADSFALTSTAINSIRQGQGTLYVEAESADVGPTQKRAIRLSGLTGDIRLAKRGVGNFAGFTKMLEVDNDLYFGAVVGNSQRCNGKEMLSFSAAVNARTGAPVTIGASTSFAYDGTNTVLYGSFTEEKVYSKTLGTATDFGFGVTQINGGTYTGTRFVFSAGVSGVVFISTDGLTYRRVNTPVIAQPTNEVTSGTVGAVNRVVIVGNAGFIATSDDQGETWTSRVSGTTQNINGVTFGANTFVACNNGTSNQIRTSTDGISWTTRTTAVAQDQADVAYNGTNLFVSVGAGGTIQTSPDGTTWTSRVSNTSVRLFGVFFANNLWVACGQNGVIVTSPDGTTWTVQNSGTTLDLFEIFYFNGVFIIAGNVLLTSPNGTTWTPRTTNVVSSLLGIAASPTRVVIAGTGGGVTTSEDAITYTSRTNNANGISGMAFGNGVFVSVGGATGGSGYIATIDAAGNYTRRVSNTTITLQNVRFLNGAFYGLINGSTQIVRSTDGITWTLVTVGTTSLNHNDIAFDGNLFVICENASFFSHSTNGTTWTQVQVTSIPSNTISRGIAFANGVWVAVGDAGRIVTSTNPTSITGWTLRISGTTQQLNSVMYSTRDQLWYAAGNAGTLLFSADAITWQSVQNAGFASIDNSGHKAAVSTRQWKDGKNTLVVSYKNNEVYTSINGFAAESDRDNSSSIPDITSGFIGENFNGLIHKVRFDPRGYSQSDTSRVSIGGVADFGSNSLSANTLGDEISVNSSGDTLNA